MIWLPGILSQGGKKYTWNRYAIAYGEVAGTAATVSRTYNYSKYASTAYTIQNGVFVLTNPVATTFENLTAGKRTVDIANSTNAVSSGSTLYKVTSNSGRSYSFTYSSSSKTITASTFYGVKSLSVNNESGTAYFGSATKWTLDELVAMTSNGFYTPNADPTQNFSSTTVTKYYSFSFLKKNVNGNTVPFTMLTYTPGLSTTVKIGYTPYTVSTTRGDLIDTVTDRDPTAYPTNGIQDGYWYVLQT